MQDVHEVFVQSGLLIHGREIWNPFVETLDVQEFLRITKIDNPIEKNYQQLLAMDFPEGAMTRGSELLRLP